MHTHAYIYIHIYTRIYICIYILLKIVGCSTISIFRQQAAFVRNVRSIYISLCRCIYIYRYIHIYNVEELHGLTYV